MRGNNLKKILNNNKRRKMIKRKTSWRINRMMADNLPSNKNFPGNTTKTEVEVEEEIEEEVEEEAEEDLIIRVTTNKNRGHFLTQTICSNMRGDRMIFNSINRDSSQVVNSLKKRKQYHK